MKLGCCPSMQREPSENILQNLKKQVAAPDCSALRTRVSGSGLMVQYLARPILQYLHG